MSSEQKYCLVTHDGNVVFLDEKSGKLIHSAIGTCEINLFFRIDEGVLHLAGLPSQLKLDNETISLVEACPITVTQSKEPNKFGLLIAGKYLCAEDGGYTTISRNIMATWETFSLVEVESLYKERISVMNRAAIPSIRFSRKFSIPKIIHQVFIASQNYSTELPETLDRHIQSIRAMNQNWQYTLWRNKDVHDFIYDHYGFDILEMYLKINPLYAAARADLFRYLCVYKLGGVYLDLKSSTRVPLDTILEDGDEFVTSQWNNNMAWSHAELEHIVGGEYQQWFIISAPGNPFLESVINEVLYKITNYSRELDGVGRLGVLRITGPIVYTLAVQKLINKFPLRIIHSENSGLIYGKIARAINGFSKHYSLLNDPIILI
jgi:hypothetical protein